jgi:hypothetical protein
MSLDLLSGLELVGGRRGSKVQSVAKDRAGEEPSRGLDYEVLISVPCLTLG